MNYFDKLPTITYNNMLCKNLLARAILSDKVREQKEVFYPYSMDSNDRADILSNDYYNTPGYTWLIWMTNNIVDPYYGMTLSDADFIQHLIKKYGTVETSNRKIKLYRNNWYDNIDETITISEFELLPSSQKKYYEPVLDIYLALNHYRRKREDMIVSTNKICTLSLTDVDGNFVVGEEVQVDADNYAFVSYFSDTSLTIQHVNGTLSGAITGQESGATATVVTNTTIANTIATDEITFWAPVTYYDYEHELNELKKKIRLLDPRYAKQAENDLRSVMNRK